MNIIAVAKDTEVIKEVATAVKQRSKDGKIRSFNDPMRAIQFGAENKVDVAVIGTKQKNMSCLVFAEMLLQKYPDVALVFCTKSNDEWNFITRSINSKYLYNPFTWNKYKKTGLMGCVAL